MQGLLPAALIARFSLWLIERRPDPPTAAVLQRFYTAFTASNTLLLLSTHADLLAAPAWNGSDAGSAGILVRHASGSLPSTVQCAVLGIEAALINAAS